MKLNDHWIYKSMFGYTKQKNIWEQAAQDVYRVLLMGALAPVLYKAHGVADTFEGRFDALLLHVFMVMHVTLSSGDARADAFNQALFDVCFQDMDQSLREAGKGDMGVSKEMKRLMLAFNGRMNRYEAAYAQGKVAFTDAIEDNLYGEGADVPARSAQVLAGYFMDGIDAMEAAGVEALFKGKIKLSKVGA